jgi:SAM-dependent methyltransferase
MSLIYNGAEITLLPMPQLPDGWYKIWTEEDAYLCMQSALIIWRDRFSDQKQRAEAVEQYRNFGSDDGSDLESKLLRTHIDQILQKKGNIRILDFGCASGGFCHFLKRTYREYEVFEYIGYDVNPDMISDAKLNFPFYDFEVTTGETIPADANQPFDLVIFSMSLHTLPNLFAIPWIEFALRNSEKLFIKDVFYELPQNLDAIRANSTDIAMQINAGGFFLFLHDWRKILQNINHNIVEYFSGIKQDLGYEIAIMILSK